jgi:hypothetical protein
METPIEDSNFWVEFEGVGTYHYSAMSDSIHLFPDAEFNHVKFWDEKNALITMQFIGQVAMDVLHQRGLPHTIRDSITETEHEAYIEWVMLNEEDELKIIEPEEFE